MTSLSISIRAMIRSMIEYIGDDPDREGLKDTPLRVIKSWDELFSGYKVEEKDIKELLTTFNEPCDSIVLVKDIEFYSTCEHHLLPFFGKAHIAYIPGKSRVQIEKGTLGWEYRTVGLSKLPRVLEVFSRRLQIQERICRQVIEALNTHIKPQGAACILEAVHHCMCARGIGKQHSVVTTSALSGAFFDGAEGRQELYSLIYGRG